MIPHTSPGLETPLGQLTDAALRLLRERGREATITESDLRQAGFADTTVRQHGDKAIAQAVEIYDAERLGGAH